MRVKKAANADMNIHVYAANLAVVTGIDETFGIDKSGTRRGRQEDVLDKMSLKRCP
jgi:hypothetical protein